jgi:hypothetical protein
MSYRRPFPDMPGILEVTCSSEGLTDASFDVLTVSLYSIGIRDNVIVSVNLKGMYNINNIFLILLPPPPYTPPPNSATSRDSAPTRDALHLHHRHRHL